MARLFTSGFEMNSNTANVEWTNTGDTPTIQTGTVRTGTYAGQIQTLTTGTPRGWAFQFVSAAASGPYFCRFYLRVATKPSADTTIFLFSSSTAVNGAGVETLIVLTSTGTLSVSNQFDGALGTSSALTLNQWYRVEIRWDRSPAAGSRSIHVALDGVEFVSLDTLTLSAANSAIQLGGNLNGDSATTCNYFFDDVAVNDSTGTSENSMPGYENVIRLSPDSAGDVNTFATQTGGTAGSSNNFTRVNEVTPDDASTFNGSSTLNQEDLFNVGASGITSTDFVKVVQVVGRFRNSTADTTAAIKFEIEKAAASTITQSAAIVPNTATWNTNKTSAARVPVITLYADPTGPLWTQTTLDSMQIGYKLTVAPAIAGRRIDVSTILAYVGYAPSTIVLDSVTTHNFTGGTTGGSFNVVVAAGNSNTKLLVNILVQDSNQHANQSTAPTYNSVTMTLVTSSIADNTPGGDRSEWWFLDSPTTGTNSLTITNGSVNNIQVAAYSIYNAASGQPEAHATTTSAGTLNLSTTITTVADKAWIFDGVMAEAVPSPVAGVMQEFTLTSQSFQNGKGAITIASPAGTYTSGYKMASSTAGALSAISVAPASAGGGAATLFMKQLLGVGF